MATETKTSKYKEAVRSLEQAAADLDTDYASVKQERLIPAIEAVVGKSLSDFKRKGAVHVRGRRQEPVKHITMLRGVRLGLAADMQLVSVTVSPEKLREREELMSIIGIGHDSATDVSERHDDYLADIYFRDLHGRS